MWTELKTYGIKLTDLSEFLQVSRPTLYRYIELYEKGDTTSFNHKILDLFNFITSPEEKNKAMITSYIMRNFVDSDDLSTDYMEAIKGILLNHGKDEIKDCYEVIKTYLSNNEIKLKINALLKGGN